MTKARARRESTVLPDRPQTGRQIIDDTLVTEAVFDMSPEEIVRGASDSEGVRIAKEAIAGIRRQEPQTAAQDGRGASE